MARISKQPSRQNLFGYPVLIKDDPAHSQYFDISELERTFHAGKNGFLIRGSQFLKTGSQISIEVLDRYDNPVFVSAVEDSDEGGSRVVSVEVYQTTPNGLGSLIILGTADRYASGQPIPNEWQNKPNVHWVVPIQIETARENTSTLRLAGSPSASITEQEYITTRITTTEVTNDVYTASLTYDHEVQASDGYAIAMSTNSIALTDSLDGNAIFFDTINTDGHFSGSIFKRVVSEDAENNRTAVVTAATDDQGYVTASVIVPLNKVLDQSTAITNTPITFGDGSEYLNPILRSGVGGGFDRILETTIPKTIEEYISNVVFKYASESLATTTDTSSIITFRIPHAQTNTGKIAKVKVLTKESNRGITAFQPFTEYVPVERNIIVSSSLSLTSTAIGAHYQAGVFTEEDLLDKNWFAALLNDSSGNFNLADWTGSADKTLRYGKTIITSSEKILNGAEVDHTASAVPYFFGTKNYYQLYKDVDYTLKYTAVYTPTYVTRSVAQTATLTNPNIATSATTGYTGGAPVVGYIAGATLTKTGDDGVFGPFATIAAVASATQFTVTPDHTTLDDIEFTVSNHYSTTNVGSLQTFLSGVGSTDFRQVTCVTNDTAGTSKLVTHPANSRIVAGLSVSDVGVTDCIPDNTTITRIISPTQFELSAAATADASVTLTFGNIVSAVANDDKDSAEVGAISKYGLLVDSVTTATADKSLYEREVNFKVLNDGAVYLRFRSDDGFWSFGNIEILPTVEKGYNPDEIIFDAPNNLLTGTTNDFKLQFLNFKDEPVDYELVGSDVFVSVDRSGKAGADGAPGVIGSDGKTVSLIPNKHVVNYLKTDDEDPLTQSISFTTYTNGFTTPHYQFLVNGNNPSTFAHSCTTNSTTTVTHAANANIAVGLKVSGGGIPADTIISSVAGNGLSFVMSNAATTGATAALTFGGTQNSTISTFTLPDPDEPAIGTTKVVTVNVTEGGEGDILARDVVSIFAGQDGSDAILAYLTNAVHAVTTAYDGSSVAVDGSGNVDGAGGTYKIQVGGTDITTSNSVEYEVVNQDSSSGGNSIKTLNGLKMSINESTGIYTLTETTTNSWNSNTQTFTLKATIPKAAAGASSDVVVTAVYSIVKSKSGDDGGRGPGIVYRGEWGADKTYYFSAEVRRDVVKYSTNTTYPYWICKHNGTTGTGEKPPTSGNTSNDFWEAFEQTFSSVATDILFAQEVSVGQGMTLGELGDPHVINTHKGTFDSASQIVTITITHSCTLNSTTTVAHTANDFIVAGLAVSGTGIPANTTISSVHSNGLSFVMNNAATVTGAQTLTFIVANANIVKGLAVSGTGIPSNTYVENTTFTDATCVTDHDGGTTLNKTVTHTANSDIVAGLSVSDAAGTVIPANTIIDTITNDTTFVMNNEALQSGTKTLTFGKDTQFVLSNPTSQAGTNITDLEFIPKGFLRAAGAYSPTGGTGFWLDTAGNFRVGGGTSDATKGHMRWDAANNRATIAGFKFDGQAMWAPETLQNNIATKLILGGLTGTPKIALGGQTASPTIGADAVTPVTDFTQPCSTNTNTDTITLSTFQDATCDYDNDPTITHNTNTKIVVGLPVSGTGIPTGATVASLNGSSNNSFELSVATEADVTDGTLTFGDIDRTDIEVGMGVTGVGIPKGAQVSYVADGNPTTFKVSIDGGTTNHKRPTVVDTDAVLTFVELPVGTGFYVDGASNFRVGGPDNYIGFKPPNTIYLKGTLTGTGLSRLSNVDVGGLTPVPAVNSNYYKLMSDPPDGNFQNVGYWFGGMGDTSGTNNHRKDSFMNIASVDQEAGVTGCFLTVGMTGDDGTNLYVFGDIDCSGTVKGTLASPTSGKFTANQTTGQLNSPHYDIVVGGIRRGGMFVKSSGGSADLNELDFVVNDDASAEGDETVVLRLVGTTAGDNSGEASFIITDNAVTTGAWSTATGDISTGGSIQASTITATTAFVPDASDGAALGTTSLEFSDLYLADGAVIGLGDDQEVTLTHVADTGLLLNGTRQLQFGDSGTYIHQSADGVLDLVSDTEIEINATTIDVNGALDVSGTSTLTGLATFGGGIQLDGGDTIVLDGGAFNTHIKTLGTSGPDASTIAFFLEEQSGNSNVESMRIDSVGNVGIGTTRGSYGALDKKLVVSGDARITGELKAGSFELTGQVAATHFKATTLAPTTEVPHFYSAFNYPSEDIIKWGGIMWHSHLHAAGASDPEDPGVARISVKVAGDSEDVWQDGLIISGSSGAANTEALVLEAGNASSSTTDRHGATITAGTWQGKVISSTYTTPHSHTGDVTSGTDGVTTIANATVDAPRLKYAAGSHADNKFLQYQTGQTGNMIWATPTDTTFGINTVAYGGSGGGGEITLTSSGNHDGSGENAFILDADSGISITLTEGTGSPDVLTFRNTAASSTTTWLLKTPDDDPRTVGQGDTIQFIEGGGGISITGAQVSSNPETYTVTIQGTNTNQLTTFQLEDGDGTEVTVGHGKEIKFVEGGNIDINWTDTSTGDDNDPYDLTFTATNTTYDLDMDGGSGASGYGVINLTGASHNDSGQVRISAGSNITINYSDAPGSGEDSEITIVGQGSGGSMSSFGVKEDGDTPITVNDGENITFTQGDNVGIVVADDGSGAPQVTISSTDTNTQLSTAEVRGKISATGNSQYNSSTGVITSTDTVYTHPTNYDGDSAGVDTTALTGATVISDLDFNITTENTGHVTDANAAVATRELSYSDIGAAASSHNHAGSHITSGAVPADHGGTGLQSFVVGQLLYASTTTALNTINIGGANQVLTVNSGVPTWQDAQGTISAVANGANNRVATFSSADALNGEANLTFDGSTLSVAGALTAAGANATAFTVYRNAGSNPQFIVNTNTDNAVTGLSVRGAAASAGTFVQVTSSGTNEKLFIDAKGSQDIILQTVSTGKVGIGTTSPDTLLQVGDNGSSGGAVKIYGVTNGNPLTIYEDTDNSITHNFYLDSSDNAEMQMYANGASSKITFSTTGQSSFNGGNLVVSNGNVGIGTASPTVNLDVYNGSGWGGIDVDGTSGGEVRLGKAGTMYGSLYASDSHGVVLQTLDNGDDSIYFKTNNAVSMMVDEAGRVGIGADPSGYAHCLTLFGANDPCQLGIVSDNSAEAVIGFYEGGSGRFYLKSINGADGLDFVDGNNVTTHMRITSGGHLAIANDKHIYLDGSDGGGNTYIKSGTTDRFDVIAGGVTAFWVHESTTQSYTGNVKCYTYGDFEAVGKVYADDMIASSDIRLKNVTGSVTNALATVNKLNAIRYTWKDKEDDREHIGFSAQDVLELVPEAVYGSEETEYGISYGKLVPVLVEAIKELTAEVEALKKKVGE